MLHSRGLPKKAITGILLLDKPVAMTSNAALQKVKRCFAAKKAGHTGSLDPLASGMLPLCLGEATKFSQFLLDADKSYQVEAKLGIKTTTGDAEGVVLSEQPVNVTEQQLLTVLMGLKGVINQIPSMYSAIKHQGQPLYKLARQGITVERKPREVNIYSIELMAFNGDSFNFTVHCSKGTYIRTLVEDIGDILGCGAHVNMLRRLTVGSLKENAMVTLAQLEEAAASGADLTSYLLSIDSVLQHWPAVSLSEAAYYYLRRGQPIIVPYTPSEGWVRLLLKDGSFIGAGEMLADGRVAPRRLVQ